jgi:hypothetical protein
MPRAKPLRFVEFNYTRDVFIEKALEELRQLGMHLNVQPVTPLVRELRLRHRAYEAAVNAWRFSSPSEAQVKLMMEFIAELKERAGFQARPTTRPPPKRYSSRPAPRSGAPSSRRSNLPTKRPQRDANRKP